jgi:bla regulator protein blaR1
MMTPLFHQVLDHLWQSTVFAAGVFALAYLLRSNRPHVRYWLWLTASVKFVIPFSLLVGAGQQVKLVTPTPVVVTPAVTQMAVQATQPFEYVRSTYSEPSRLPVIPIVWGCGSLLVFASWLRSGLRLRRILANSTPVPELAAKIPVRSSSTLIEPGVVGLFRPVLLIPDGLLRNLTAEQFTAILAHELCHVRRRDNLAAAFHMAVETIFWFHPLIWWIGARLIEERERACDEEVLRLGAAPEAYAGSILNVCKFYVQSPLPCASGVTGADLKLRVLQIMTGSFGQSLSAARKMLIAALGLCAVAVPLTVGALTSKAQSEGSGKFDVASIRVNDTGSNSSSFGDAPNGGIRAVNTTALKLIMNAYGVREFQVEGGPEWIRSTRFDIQATVDDPNPIHPRNMTAEQRKEHIAKHLQRLRHLLVERFSLRVKHETEDKSGFALVIARGGHKLQPPSVSEHNTSSNTSMGTGRGSFSALGADMELLTAQLSNILGRKVVDETGIIGRYDLKVEWTPDDAAASAAGDDSKGSLFVALQEQLGLKLESKKVPTDIIVIEHIDKPSEN